MPFFFLRNRRGDCVTEILKIDLNESCFEVFRLLGAKMFPKLKFFRYYQKSVHGKFLIFLHGVSTRGIFFFFLHKVLLAYRLKVVLTFFGKIVLCGFLVKGGPI